MDTAGKNSYRIKRLSFCIFLGRSGTVVKETFQRMEPIPTTLVLHRMFDMRMVEMATPFSMIP